MKQLTIKYNPYCISTEFAIDGVQPKMDSSLNVGNSRLQEWAELLPNWLVMEFGDKDWEVRFIGTEDDLSDLRAGFNQSSSGVTAKFFFKRMPDVAEAEGAIETIFNEIQNGPIQELKSQEIRDAFEKAKNQEFEINVVATMSSGKSTLINSLLGSEQMPSANEATTATIVRITDVDGAKSFKAKAYSPEGELVKTLEEVTLEDTQEMNKDENISLIDMEGPIPFVSASGMKLVLIDTPGPNNARNKQHEEMTYRMIANSDKSMVLFVMNAQQIGINDEKMLLDYVCNCMKKGGKQSKDRFLFVINKINCFDPQPKHDGPGCIRRVLEGVKKDLEDRGIRNPNIFPVAALPALQLREKDRFGTVLQGYRMFSDAFEEMRFDQYADFSHLPSSIQKSLETGKKNASPDDLVEIYTGIVSLEEAIKLYVKKYARTTKVMDLVLAFNSKLEELSAEASLRESLRKNQAVKAEMERQIVQVRKNIETARNAQTFSAKVEKLDLVSGAQRETKLLFDGLRTDISKMMAGRDTMVELSKAQMQCADIEKRSQSIQSQLKVEVEKIIVDTYKNTVENIISEYKKYLKDLNMGSEGEKLKLNPLKLVASEVKDINALIKANSQVKNETEVKLETYQVTSGYDKSTNIIGDAIGACGLGLAAAGVVSLLCGPVALAVPVVSAIWGGMKGAKEGDTRKTESKIRRIELPKQVTYVDMSVVASEFLQPIQEDLANTEKVVLDYVKQETVEVKSFINRKLQEIDKVLDSKLSMLSQYETGVKEMDADIAERQNQLEWLENIEKRVNSIVKF